MTRSDNVQIRNLLAALPGPATEEDLEVLAEAGAVRIERIVSHGHVTPADQWYDQPRDELVVVLQGEARLTFDGRADEPTLRPGDWLVIPAGARHRVAWTTTEGPTVWLCVHYPNERAARVTTASSPSQGRSRGSRGHARRAGDSDRPAETRAAGGGTGAGRVGLPRRTRA